MLGIAGRLDHRPSELSGGRTTARRHCPRADYAARDRAGGRTNGKSGYRNSDAVLEMLRRSNQEFKQTVLMITHNPEAARLPNAFCTCATAE